MHSLSVRRTTAIIAMCAMLSGMTPTPARSEPVSETADSMSRGGVIVHSVVTYSRSGDSQLHQGTSPAAFSALPNVQGGITPEILAKIRADLRRFEKVSKRGAAAFTMTHQVIDAFGAPKEEFHDRIAQLPVSVSVTTIGHEAGRNHTRRDYYVSGQLKLSVVVSVPAGEEPSRPALSSSAEFNTPEGDAEEVHVSAPSNYCEYTDPETSEFFSGDCATQQEIDDALIAIAAVESEIEWVSLELDETFEEYCANITEITVRWEEGCESQNFSTLFHQSAPDAGLLPYGESADTVYECSSSDSATLSDVSCAAEIYFAGLAVAGWFGTKYAALAVMTAIAPPAAAVAWAAFGVIAGGASAAFGVASAIQCMRSE